MKLKDIIKESTNNLNKFGIEDSSVKVKILIEYVFRISKEQIILNYNNEIEQEKLLEFNNLLEQIKSGTPIQYITNSQEFMGLNFFVNEGVLIPQPDTEVLVEEVIKYCNQIRHNKNDNKRIKILDLCTGSGAIGISLYKYLENVEIYLSDISKKALEVASKNAKQNNAIVNFICSDMFENIKEKDFDIIVSNPPYISSSIINSLSNEVKKEPKLALDGGKDGLDFYKIISKKAIEYIKQDGCIFLEIGYDQKEKVCEIFNKFNSIKCVKDLSGNDRVIIVKNYKEGEI